MEAAAASGPPGPPGHAPLGVRDAARLLCLVGYHVPDASMVWHQGYGFAHCRRCGQAIVRSLLSNWIVPGPGLRIVWARADGAKVGAAVAVAEPAVVEALVAVVEPIEATVDGSDGAAGKPVGAEVEPVEAGAAAEPVTVQPLAIAPDPIAPDPVPEPVDLLGPHFMGDVGAPPGPRDGLEVFEFDDMAAGDGPAGDGAAGEGGFGGNRATQRAS